MPQSQRTCLLLVEDDGLIRLEMTYTLEDLDFSVIEAADADAALHILDTRDDIAAILTDIDMPGAMNGIGLAHLVSRCWPQMKILVISGRYSPDTGILPASASFMSKPVTQARLRQILKKLDLLMS